MSLEDSTMQDLHTNVALFSETNMKPQDRFFIPNSHFYRTDSFQGRNGVTTIAVRKDIPQTWGLAPFLFSRSHRGLPTE
jgi:hypothetical protein